MKTTVGYTTTSTKIFGVGLVAVIAALLFGFGASGAHAAVLSAGSSHVCAVSAGGTAECWGSNDHGQLGTGGTTDSSTPVQVQGLGSGITSVAAGEQFSCAVQNGAAKCWGTNFYGLGDGSSYSSVPVQVSGLGSGVTDVSVGKYHACAIVGGAAKCWGQDLRGELGDGHNGFGFDSPTPVPVIGLAGPVTAISAGWYDTCALVDHSVSCWGDGFNPSGALQIPGLGSGVTAISDGGGTCGVVFGAVKCWNETGATAIGGLTAGVTSVSTPSGGGRCAIVAGAVKCWGRNYYGALGNGDDNDKHFGEIPVQVSGIAVGATAVTTGEGFACAVVANQIKCWGKNLEGQLGTGTNGGDSQSSVPVAVSNLPTSGVMQASAGDEHECAVVSGAAKCWGGNADGQLGTGDFSSSSVPVDVQGLTSSVTQIATDTAGSCALVSGAVECWGYGSSTPVAVSGAASGVTSISTAGAKGCAVVSGAAKCWGHVPTGGEEPVPTPDLTSAVTVTGLESGVTQVSVGGGYACAVQSGAAKCWGENSSGQLGNGSTIDSISPASVTGLSTGVTAVSAGHFHTCAVVSGAAKCWGVNTDGQLGNGSTSNSNDSVTMPVQVSELTAGVTSIAVAGEYDDVSKSGFSCAVVSGAAKCWGINKSGSLGNGSTTNSTTPVEVVGLTSGVTSVSAGSSDAYGWRACAVVIGSLKCWGDNGFSLFGSSESWHRIPVSVPVFVPAAVDVVPPINPPTDITPPVFPPTAQPLPLPASTRPVLGKVAATVRANKPIAIPISCTTVCTISLTLKLGKKKVKLPSVKVPAGTTTGAPLKVKLSAKAKNMIKKALKKKQKVSLLIQAVSSSGASAPVTVKLK